MATILCLDDDPSAVLVLRDALRRAGHESIGVHNVDAAMKVLDRGGVDIIVSDFRMPDATGLAFLSRLSEAGHDVPLIMVTGYASIETAVASIKAGAIDYITKPVRPEQLQLAVDQALELIRLRRENEALAAEVTQLRSRRKIVGESEALTRLLETVSTVAPTSTTVLLQGESGTGKELIARTIHEQSGRSGRFVSVNCAALPETLVESTLFGHEKGAFTGAVRRVKGAFERASGGTLLLDEISEMRPEPQAKLLRVLQEQEFERVGGTTTVRVDTRIVATTNRDLAAEVRADTFREDLFYRLNVMPLRVPPLRERVDDIPLLAQHFAIRTATELGKKITGIAPETLEVLQSYDWPGNVRELAHTIERAVILSGGPVLEPESLEPRRFGLAPSATAGALEAMPTGATTDGNGHGAAVVLHTYDIAEAEKVLIEHALRATEQNRTRAAELLGISARTLRNKLNRPAKDD